MKIDYTNLTGKLLIAMPTLLDPNFSRSVVLILSHSKDGAVGVVINRTLKIPAKRVFKDIGIDEPSLLEMPVHYGGPVGLDLGFIIHNGRYDKQNLSTTLENGISFSTAREILKDIAFKKGPEKFIFAIGYAGWAPMQLENEIMKDGWLVAESSMELIFDIPADDKWGAAAKSIGVDFSKLVMKSGNA